MRKILISLIACIALVSPARADFTAKDATPATITFKNASGACSSVVCVPQSAITDSTGANYVAVPSAGADAQSNTANGLLGYSRLLIYNGATWDRLMGDLTNGMWVNVKNSVPLGAAAPASASPVTPSNQPVGGANFANTQVSVGNTATSIVAARTGVAGTGRISATICNTSTVAVYLGGSGVTTSTGQLLAGVAGACATFNTTAAIYGIVATGTETVGATEVY